MSAHLPLGTTVILPGIHFGEWIAAFRRVGAGVVYLTYPYPSHLMFAAESLGHLTLLVIQAPLPSAERVASAVEWALDVSKRALTKSAREVYYYVQVIRTQRHSCSRKGSRLTCGDVFYW